MNRRKKEIKQIFIVSIFVISIFLTNTQIFNKVNLAESNDNGQVIDDNEIMNLSPSSDPYLSDYYLTGSGDNQDVRIYVTNTSSLMNNQKHFDIPSMSNSIDSYLSSGDFNFTFQNNFTTDYVLEDNSALEATSFIEFDMNRNPGYSELTLNQGTNSTNLDLGHLNDNNNDTYAMLHGDSGGIINFTLTADFSDTSFQSSNPNIDLDFNRSLILGFILLLRLESSRNASMIIKMKDSIGSGWIDVTHPIFLNTNLNIHNIENRIINENLKYIDLTNKNEVQFYISRGDTEAYNVTIFELGEVSTYAFDIPITNKDHVALEFDLKGENSTVNGFYAWIRTLNLTKAISSELNFTLYKANTTVSRTQDNLFRNTMEPDYAEQIDSFTLDYAAYHGDNLTYFGFNLSNTANMILYNYFIVIKSNNSNLVYSLVTLPRETFGDPDTTLEHQLKMSSDNGTSWINARKYVDVTYTSESLDASSFKLNVTRGYMPSDFMMSEVDKLNIQDIPIENQVFNTGIYATSSSLTWGKGRWNNNFNPIITSNPQHDYQISLDWNNSIIKGFQFDVTYNAKAFWVDPATTSYNVSYDTTPRWKFEYTFDANNVNFNQWDFLEFWFVYPNYFDATNLTNPSSIDIYNNTESVLEDLTNYDKTNVSLANAITGLYTLDLISPNAIHDMHSYIDYSGRAWETNGFMYGDSITAQLDIQGANGDAPSNGMASVVLFYPGNNSKYPIPQRDDSSGVKEEKVLIYDFDNVTILNVDTSVPLLGKYYLGFFWSNGSAIGCKKLTLYINTYDANLQDFFYEPLLEKNVLSGIVDKVYDNYSILIATVNETTGQNLSNFYAVNQSDVNQEYVLNVSGEEVPILLKSFLQNETILNPAEKIKFTMTLQNLDELIDLDVKVKVKLVALCNEEWIIDEVTSPVETLKLKGDPSGGDSKEFTVELEIPDFEVDGTWYGLNAPMRKGGAKTITDIYIGDTLVGTYKSNDYSLLINDTEDVFEGYIIALKYDQEITGASILKPFERDECTYIPDSTKVIVNIYDDNFMSSYRQINASFDIYMNSEFRNVLVTPENPIRGNILNISSTLTTEFGTELANKNVTCQYDDTGEWINITSQLTDSNGSTLFEIDTVDLNDEGTLLFRLIWPGDQYLLNVPYNISVDLLQDVINVSISLQGDQIQIYRNTKAIFIISLENLGSYDVKIANITIDVNPNLPNQIIEINTFLLNQFYSGHKTSFIIEVDVSSITQFSLSVSADVQNLLTKEVIAIHSSESFETFERSLFDYIMDYFILIMFAIFGLLALVTILYIKKTKKDIETPIEEPLKKKTRRGKYLSVSEIPTKPLEAESEKELSKENADKKIRKKKKKEPEPEKPKSTDLDSLLEEKGLKDDDK